MNVIIGTRGSKLALAQAEYVKNRLQKHYPQNSYELKIISTKGDREQKKALDQIGDKGLFVRFGYYLHLDNRWICLSDQCYGFIFQKNHSLDSFRNTGSILRD